MKYSKNFNRDFEWYLSVRKLFNFDGYDDWEYVVYDKNGVDGKKAFHIYDSLGKVAATKHPNILHTLLKTKGSVNLHIKMYAEDRAKGLFPLIEFRAFCIKLKAPYWFKEAVENQKYKYYPNFTQ